MHPLPIRPCRWIDSAVRIAAIPTALALMRISPRDGLPVSESEARYAASTTDLHAVTAISPEVSCSQRIACLSCKF